MCSTVKLPEDGNYTETGVNKFVACLRMRIRREVRVALGLHLTLSVFLSIFVGGWDKGGKARPVLPSYHTGLSCPTEGNCLNPLPICLTHASLCWMCEFMLTHSHARFRVKFRKKPKHRDRTTQHRDKDNTNGSYSVFKREAGFRFMQLVKCRLSVTVEKRKTPMWQPGRILTLPQQHHSPRASLATLEWLAEKYVTSLPPCSQQRKQHLLVYCWKMEAFQKVEGKVGIIKTRLWCYIVNLWIWNKQVKLLLKREWACLLSKPAGRDCRASKNKTKHTLRLNAFVSSILILNLFGIPEFHWIMDTQVHS